jgi:hypothetical protein
MLLRGERIPDLHPRFDFQDVPPIHLFARLDRGCLPWGFRKVNPLPNRGVPLIFHSLVSLNPRGSMHSRAMPCLRRWP